MPHALFLGSSLAGIDRLDMIPRPPLLDDKTKRSFKMPALGLVRRLKGRSTPAVLEEETIEMRRTTSSPLPRLTETTILDDGSGRELDADSKPDVLPPATQKVTEHEAALRQYEADLKAFDRIRWTDLHISHATVSSSARFPVRS
jgi:metal iron transporter